MQNKKPNPILRNLYQTVQHSLDYERLSKSGENLEGSSFFLDLEGDQEKEFSIKYDKKNQAFRVYQKGKYLKENINPEALHQLEQIISDGYAAFVMKSGEKNHLMVDAASLRTIFSSLELDIPKGLNEMASLENQTKDDLVDLCSVQPWLNVRDVEKTDELAVLLKENRVFMDKDPSGNVCWTTCIDTEKDTYLSATQDQLTTLVGYLQGDLYLRRKKELPIKVFPISQLIQRREFKDHDTSEDANIKLIIDGADDTASALTSSGLPQQTVNAIQSLLVFPAFLSLVQIGVDGMSEELEESKEKIIETKKTIAACNEDVGNIKELVEKIKNNPETLPDDIEEKLKEVIISIATLQDNLVSLPEEKSEKTANMLGAWGMKMMFNGLLGYEIQSFLNLVGGIDFVSKGFEGTAIGAKFGQDPLLPLGLAGIAGTGFVFGGQVLMTVFAAMAVKEEFENICETNKEIDTLKLSESMTDVFKKELITFKKDGRLFAAQRLAGNAMLGAGQAMMATTGPVGLAFNPLVYAGLGLTIMGVGVNSSSQLRETKLYGDHKESSDLAKNIISKAEHAITAVLSEDLKNPVNEDSKKASEKKYSEIVRGVSFELEVLNHLQKMPLVTHKLFKESLSTTDLETAKKKGKGHYQSRSHQQGLLKALEGLELPENVTEFLKTATDKEVLLKILNRLNPTEDNAEFLKTATDEEVLLKILEGSDLSEDLIKTLKECTKEKGLLKTLEESDLSEDIIKIIKDADLALDFMKKTAVLYDITKELKPSEEDLSWIPYIAEFLHLKSGAYDEDARNAGLDAIITQMDGDNDVPDEVMECFSDLTIKGSSQEDIIKEIQKAYVRLKLKGYNPSQYAGKDMATLKKELSKKILDSGKPKQFIKRMLDGSYVKKEKEEDTYTPDNLSSPIHIVGTLTKRNKGIFKDQIHTKNVYAFNKEALDQDFTPDDKIFKGHIEDKKYDARSDYFGSAHAVLESETEKKGAAAMELLEKSSVAPINETATPQTTERANRSIATSRRR